MKDYDVTKFGGYLKIPLPLIRLLLVRPKEAENVMGYAIMATAYNHDADVNNIYRQILYLYTVGLQSANYASYFALKEDVLDEIEEGLRNLVENCENCEDYEYSRKGWQGDGGFDDSNIDELKNLIPYESAIFERAEMWYKLRQVCQNIGVKQLPTSVYQSAYEHISSYNVSCDIFGYINVQMLQKYADKAQNGIYECERVQFACYCGIKSIIGLDDYGRASKDLILARMVGLRSGTDLSEDFLAKKCREEIKRIIEKYSRRRKFVGLLNDMVEYGYLRTCFGRRKSGYYFSTKYSEQEVMLMVMQADEYKRIASTRVQTASAKFAEMSHGMKMGNTT